MKSTKKSLKIKKNQRYYKFFSFNKFFLKKILKDKKKYTNILSTTMLDLTANSKWTQEQYNIFFNLLYQSFIKKKKKISTVAREFAILLNIPVTSIKKKNWNIKSKGKNKNLKNKSQIQSNKNLKNNYGKKQKDSISKQTKTTQKKKTYFKYDKTKKK